MSDTTMTFNCPSCDSLLQVPVVLAGVTGPCPDCDETITAPGEPNLIDEDLNETAGYSIQPPPALPAGFTNPSLPSVYMPQLTKPGTSEKVEVKPPPIPLAKTVTAPASSTARSTTKSGLPERPRAHTTQAESNNQNTPPKYPPLVITPYEPTISDASLQGGATTPPPIPSVMGRAPANAQPTYKKPSFFQLALQSRFASVLLTGIFTIFALAIILSILAHLQLIPVPKSLENLPILKKEQAQAIETKAKTLTLPDLQAPQPAPRTELVINEAPQPSHVQLDAEFEPEPEAIVVSTEQKNDQSSAPSQISSAIQPEQTIEPEPQPLEAKIPAQVETEPEVVEVSPSPDKEEKTEELLAEDSAELIIPIENDAKDVPALKDTLEEEIVAHQDQEPENIAEEKAEPETVESPIDVTNITREIAGYDDTRQASHPDFDRELWRSGARTIESFFSAANIEERKTFIGSTQYTNSQLSTLSLDQQLEMPILLSPLKESAGAKQKETHLLYSAVWRSPAAKPEDIVTLQVTHRKDGQSTLHLESFIDLRLGRLNNYLKTPATEPKVFYALAAAFPSLKPSTSKSPLAGKLILKLYDHPNEREIGQVYLDPDSSAGLEFMKDNSFGEKKLCKLTLQWNLGSPAEFFIGVQGISALNWSQ